MSVLERTPLLFVGYKEEKGSRGRKLEVRVHGGENLLFLFICSMITPADSSYGQGPGVLGFPQTAYNLDKTKTVPGWKRNRGTKKESDMPKIIQSQSVVELGIEPKPPDPRPPNPRLDHFVS